MKKAHDVEIPSVQIRMLFSEWNEEKRARYLVINFRTRLLANKKVTTL